MRRTTARGAAWTVIGAAHPRSREVAAARAILAAVTSRLESGPPRIPRPRTAAAPRGRGALARVDLGVTIRRKDYRPAPRRPPGPAQPALGGRAPGRGEHRARVRGLGRGGQGRRDPARHRARSTPATTASCRSPRRPSRSTRTTICGASGASCRATGTSRSSTARWYGRVLVERVEGFATEVEWRRAYGEINDFEDQLVERGTVLLQVLAAHLAGRAARALPGAREDALQEVQDHRRGLPQPRQVGRLRRGGRRDGRAHQSTPRRPGT